MLLDDNAIGTYVGPAWYSVVDGEPTLKHTPCLPGETAVHNIRSTYGYINVVAQYWAGVRFVETYNFHLIKGQTI